MHETGIVRDLVNRLVAAAREAGAERVSGVEIWVGALSQFSPEHLREHFDDEARGTIAQDAELRIEASQDVFDPNAQSLMLRNIDLEVSDRSA